MKQNISYTDLEQFDQNFHASRMNITAMNAVTANGVAAAAKRWQAPTPAVHQYSVHLDQHGVANQMHSGRCWMFAALNCLRYQVIHRLNLDQFELSQNYTFFYDKLEKANYFYDNILATTEEATGSRILDHLLRPPVQDGGQWDMVSALIQKYGVVPKSAMPESACSSDSKEMDSALTGKLRHDAALLRAAAAEGKDAKELQAMKEEMLCEVYRMLCICLGTPPETFDFCVRTKDGRYICDSGLTPKCFYEKYVDVDLSEYISLIHAPTADKPYLKSYTVKFLGNVVGGDPVRYVNVPIEELKKAAIAQLKDGEPVWFGSDVSKYSDRPNGLMDLNVYDYETLMGTQFHMNKADRLNYGHSAMNHAMVFQGVDLDAAGKPVRWCVENSWGDEKGEKGMFLMTDAWFDEYMYQVVVNKKYLSADILDAYQAEPIVLSPWDPMGALAWE
ncbi:MAG: C1 family peptidase [Clostridiales bacterium]|nr:C1 family peptidase [Clostridiales bacterium]